MEKMDLDKFNKYAKEFIQGITNESSETNTSVTMGNGYMYWYSPLLLTRLCQYVIDDKVGKYFDWKQLSDKFIYTLGSGIATELNVSQIIKNMEKIVHTTTTEFRCLIPVHGLILDDEWCFGGIKFYPYKQKAQMIKQITGNQRDEKQLIHDLHDKQNFAFVTIKAANPGGAVSIARKRVQSVLNVLLFFTSNPLHRYNLGIGKSNVSMEDKEFVAISDRDGIVNRPYSYFPMYLEVKKDISWGSTVMLNISPIVDSIENNIKDEQGTSPLEKGIYNAINLIAAAIDSDSENYQIVNLMAAVESLIEENTKNITKQICRRVAILLGADNKKRNNIYKKLIDLYDKRSKLSHGEIVLANHYDVMYLWNVARELVYYFLINFEQLNDSKKYAKKPLKIKLLKIRFGTNLTHNDMNILLTLLNCDSGLSKKDILNRVKLTKNQVSYSLVNLREKNIVRKQGNSVATRYMVTPINFD